ncbi:ankyrin repeat domain-containing protein 26 isoform X3 [Gouania willdenowi]|uniref:ankyrin repeat domain-containing protein 26 isoform X3 n=1 Tax=Gouania willdenowi TaxID=441366 RepID=UPI001054EFE1|nr:ankyrin repeat domain-containing protein 26-like isoform X3 [Gouania willdenowi]
MKKIFGFTKKKRSSSSTPDNGSVLSVGYELKDKDLGKVHKAASVGDLTKLKQLAKKNDINQLDKENRTALHIACANGHVELVQFLVESKAKLDLCDNQNRSALMKAVQCQHERCVSILLENHANPNLVDINGNTALHLAANIPSVSTAVLLLQYDAEINSQNKEGFTPLMVAVREDHIEMADFLLKEAAKVNLTDQRQRSSLMIAAGNGQIRMVRLLLQFDADIMLKDASGYSADDYAVMNGHHPCSHLIIEHGTRRTDRASLSNQGQCKKKKVTGTSSQDVEAGFSLGGPAADKDDYEEDSQSQSLSRVSKSAADEWLSSDDDDESVLVEKKQLKVNLSKMISSKAEAAALHDSSESEQESETRILRIPSQAKASPSLKLLPVDPSPDPLPSKEPQMASTPLPLCTQKSNSSQDEDDDLMDEDDQPVENDGVLEACSPAADAEVSTDKRRDFRSELGLDKHEDEQDSWDSEVPSEELLLPPKEHPRLVTQDQEKATVRDEIKENLLYIPSFLRLDTVSRMEMSEPRRDVGRPGYSQGTDGASSEDPIRADSVKLGQCEENQREKEAEKTKWQALSVLSKLQEDGEQKSEEFMEELGLGDADDLEDASDWDSASTTSRRTLPGRRMTSPGHEDFLEGSGGPVKEQDKEYSPQQSISPVPVPRTRKVDAQKEEEPDWDKITSTKVSPNDDQTVAELPTSSPEIPLKAKHSTSSSEDDQLKQKRKDDAVGRSGLEVNASGPVGCDSHGKEDLQGQCSAEENKDMSEVQWEKRYEKLWVEVEKREMKSTFSNVAGELKEKFRQLPTSRPLPENILEEVTAGSTSAEEESSDEDDEVIVRPIARARSTVLLSIPEQRESGLEDSESSDNSFSEDKIQDSKQPAHQAASLITDSAKDLNKTALDSDLVGSTVSSSEAEKSNLNPVDHDTQQSSLHPLQRQSSPPVSGVSNEELEEDMERFKHEPEEKTPITTVEMLQTSNTEGVDGQKSEIRSGCPVGEEVHQQEQPMAAKSAAVPLLHLPVHQNSSSTKQEKEAVQMMLQLQRLRAPLTSTHVNGDPFPVFDDSTLSDVSDDEGRLPARERHKMQKTEEVDLAEDFDELTQSSDTATDDIESPTSGYHNASLLIQKLDLPDLEPRTKVKLQNMFYEYERSNQKTRSRCEYEVNKVRQLESEKAELKSSLENIHDIKSALERNQLELQTEVTNLKFHLKQEQENRRNATMMYNTCQDKLRRMEEQHQLEVQERQNVELTLRNHELEMRTLLNNMKQLEEDHIETQRQLAQERSTRALQESLLNNHLRRQQDIEEENQRNMSKSSEALSQLTEATDRERELVQHNSSLQEQLTTARAELQGCLTSSSLKESHLTEEKEALKEQLEDSRRDLKLSNEALSQTVFTCDQQMTQLKTELAMATMRLETERQTCQTLEAKVESTQTCLTGALKEAELCIAARADVEKVLHREKEEHQRLKDRFTDEMASQREAVTLLSQKLSNAEARANSLENEVHRASLQLTEKGVLLDVLQREKDQAAARLKETETALRAEAELVTRARASQEAMQERLAQTQSEGMLLRQQLEESQNKGSAKEQAVTDAQGLFSDILSKVRSDCEERVQLVEDRNKELVTKVADQRDHIYKLEEEKNDREASLRQLQQELADSLKRVSMSEASLEVNTRYRNDLEEEKARLLKDVERLKTKLEDWEDQYVQAEKHIAGLKSDVDQKEREVGNTTQKLQEALSASASSHVTIKQLEEAIQRLEIDNARLEAAAKQQSTKIEDLQKEVREANMLSGGSPGGRVRGHLEVLVTNLQSSKMTLEEQLNSEVQKQSMLSHTAQDSQALWEEELKSRSKLGLHLAELEKEKGELNSQMELEKKKAKKIAEQKKSVDTRLDQEMKRNAELQKEMYRLRTLLKTAKKKLRDQDGAGAEFVSPLSSLRLEQGRHSHVDGTFARMQTTVEDLSGQLEKEASRRSQLERLNEELKDQMASMTGRNYSNEQLERSKKQLEEEVLDLRRRVELAKVEHDQMEHYRRDAEEKARQEVQQKLEQVNLFLQTQAASQEALDRIKSANEVNLRSQLEQRIRELEEELSRAHSSQQDSLHQRESTRIELQRCHTLYADELRVRKSLEAKLERANVRLAEANSKLLGEHSRSLISSSMVNSSIRGSVMPSNHSLGLSFLRPPQGQSSNTDDFLTKMQRELDRSISKELSSAKAELDIATARLSPVGSASRAEADPVSRATQQYLEVLKKNYMI